MSQNSPTAPTASVLTQTDYDRLVTSVFTAIVLAAPVGADWGDMMRKAKLTVSEWSEAQRVQIIPAS